jgi:small subunit ribosomal protein S20
MPNIKSATKRMELSYQARDKNRAARSRIRTAIKKVRSAENAEAAAAGMRDAVSALDRASRKRLMHPNRAARIKSQLQRHVNGLSA